MLINTLRKNDIKKSFAPILGLEFLLVIVFCFLACFQSCQRPDETQAIRGVLQSVAELAEKKDRAKIIDYLSSEYRDFEGRDPEQTASLLEHYFKNYQEIVIHLLDIYVNINEGQAEAEADVLLSSGPLDNLRRLVGVIGVYYRFNFNLENRAGRWKITSAAWSEIDANSLLPGSKVILKKIITD